MAPTQMNTRIDYDLKVKGDAVLAEIGLSPSQAVRILWGFLVANAQNVTQVRNMMAELDSSGAFDERSSKKRAALAQSSQIIDELANLAHDQSWSSDDPLLNLSGKELRDYMYESKLQEG